MITPGTLLAAIARDLTLDDVDALAAQADIDRASARKAAELAVPALVSGLSELPFRANGIARLTSALARYDVGLYRAIKLLTQGRETPDKTQRTTIYEDLNKRFGEEVYNLWLGWTIWGISSQPYVNDQVLNTLPDGSKGIELAFAGRHQLNQIWCDDGKCE